MRVARNNRRLIAIGALLVAAIVGLVGWLNTAKIGLVNQVAAALQIQTELDLARSVALKFVQDESVRIKLVGGGNERKIFLEVVRAGGRLERNKFVVGAGLLKRGGRREDIRERGVAVLRAAGGIVLANDGGPLGYGKIDAGLRNGGFVAWGDPTFAAGASPKRR